MTSHDHIIAFQYGKGFGKVTRCWNTWNFRKFGNSMCVRKVGKTGICGKCGIFKLKGAKIFGIPGKCGI